MSARVLSLVLMSVLGTSTLHALESSAGARATTASTAGLELKMDVFQAALTAALNDYMAKNKACNSQLLFYAPDAGGADANGCIGGAARGSVSATTTIRNRVYAPQYRNLGVHDLCIVSGFYVYSTDAGGRGAATLCEVDGEPGQNWRGHATYASNASHSVCNYRCFDF